MACVLPVLPSGKAAAYKLLHGRSQIIDHRCRVKVGKLSKEFSTVRSLCLQDPFRFGLTFIATSVKNVALRDEPTSLIFMSYLSTTPLGSFGGFQETRHYKKHRYPC